MKNVKKIMLTTLFSPIIILPIYSLTDETQVIGQTISSSDSSFLPDTTSSNTSVISDDALQSFILTTLGKSDDSPLSIADIESLTSLNIPESVSDKIHSLSGLEYAKNLLDLNMMYTTNVSDFSPLENLTNLVIVRLEGKNVTSENMPDLSKNTKIHLLSLTSSSIDNNVFPKITSLTSLQRLFMDNNPNITTIEPLKVMPNLNTIRMQFNGVHDFTILNDFPSLVELHGFGQKIGRNDGPTILNSTKLNYQPDKQELFLPFSVLPNRLTNFDGYTPPFSSTNTFGTTYLEFNGYRVADNRLTFSAEGIQIATVTPADFDTLSSIMFSASIDNPANTYQSPAGYSSYSISSGNYMHTFTITHEPDEGAPVIVKYLDDASNELTLPDILNGKIGEPYETIAKDFSGWSLKDIPDNTTGLFSAQTQEVIYTYKKANTSPVTVRYIDNLGNELAPFELLTGEFNTPYKAVQKKFSGWKLTSLPANEIGFFTVLPQTVTYQYEKIIYPIEPQKDKGTTVVKPKTGLSSPISQSSLPHLLTDSFIYTSDNQFFSLLDELYKPVLYSTNHSLEQKDESLVKTVNKSSKKKKTKQTGSITIKFVDEDGNELAPSKTIVDEIGKNYTPVAKKSADLRKK